MFLLLSGEGQTDIGTSDNEVGPMAKWIDTWIQRRLGYSLLDYSSFKIVSKHELTANAKQLKARSKRGKKNAVETRYYYKNARVLALMTKEESQTQNIDTNTIIPVLFRDTDNTASSGRGEWKEKWESILNGFKDENVETGVPMIPKPKSEAWILCALRNKYQNCASLENESGNDNSPNSLKVQLDAHLGEPVTREQLNQKIDQGEIDINRIVDMPSLNKFKNRLNEVMDHLNIPKL